MPSHRWSVSAEEAGRRLDACLAGRTGSPRNQVQRWIRDGLVSINGRSAKSSTAVAEGDTIDCRRPPPPVDDRVRAEAGPLTVLHEEDDFLLIDKPPGLAVHPGAGRPSGTLVHRLLATYPEVEGVGGPGRPGIVHRLDLDTSGLMVIARSATGYRALSAQFAARSVDKRYAAVVYGRPVGGRIDAPIGRHPGDRKRMAVRERGRPALTEYETVATVPGVALLAVTLLTGRTHQIRVHLKHVGHPLVGDPIYGEARWKGLEVRLRGVARGFERPALHALSLAFDHPRSGARLEFTAPLAADLERLWRDLGGESAARALA